MQIKRKGLNPSVGEEERIQSYKRMIINDIPHDEQYKPTWIKLYVDAKRHKYLTVKYQIVGFLEREFNFDGLAWEKRGRRYIIVITFPNTKLKKEFIEQWAMNKMLGIPHI